MKPDLYTKAVLTAIAIALTVIACNQYVTPSVTAQAQSGQFGALQYSSDGGRPTFFDPRTGEIWGYHGTGNGGKLEYQLRLVKPGQPLTIEQPER